MLLDVFTRTPGKGRRIGIITIDGQAGQFLLPFERKLLVAHYECAFIILYTRGDGKDQYYIEHYGRPEPFETSHGVLALNYLLYEADIKLNDRKMGECIRTFLGGAGDFMTWNYDQYLFSEFKRQWVKDWFTVKPYRAGCDDAIKDITLKYRIVGLSPLTITYSNLSNNVKEDVDNPPIFIHQFGIIGFTLVGLKTKSYFSQIDRGIPEALINERLNHHNLGDCINAGTVFFNVSPPVRADNLYQENVNFKGHILFEIYGKMLAPTVECGTAATTLAAYMAIGLGCNLVRGGVAIGERRIYVFGINLDTANTTKCQDCYIEVTVEIEIDRFQRTKIVDLEFGAPIVVVKREVRKVTRVCLNPEFKLYRAKFGRVDDLTANLNGEGEGSLLSLSKKERKYLARMFKEDDR